MEKKDSLIFYLSQYEAVKSLTNEQLGRLYRAIFEKQLGNEVVLEEDIIIAYNFINNQLVVDNKKYEEISVKRSNSGKKGGAPKGNKNATKNKQTNKNKQNKLNDNVNDNDNDNVNDNDNENDNDNVINVVCSSLERIYARAIVGPEYEMIQKWLKDYDLELIEYAINISAVNNRKNVKYVNGILRNWKHAGYKTKQDVLDNEKKIEEIKNKEPEELFDYNWLEETED